MPMKVSNGYTQEVYNQTRSIMLSSPVDFCCIAAEGFWIKTFYKSIPPNDPPHGYLFFFLLWKPLKNISGYATVHMYVRMYTYTSATVPGIISTHELSQCSTTYHQLSQMSQ